MKNILIHSFLENMKLPTSNKPTSGFHISDILELNKDKHQKKPDAEKIEEKSSKMEAHCDEVEVELKTEKLSCESDENFTETCNKRKLVTSPSMNRESLSPRDEKELKKSKRNLKQEDRATLSSYQLFSETMHQYPHLFQNHPAIRQPWMQSNGKLRHVIKILFESSTKNRHGLIEWITMESMINVEQLVFNSYPFDSSLSLNSNRCFVETRALVYWLNFWCSSKHFSIVV